MRLKVMSVACKVCGSSCRTLDNGANSVPLREKAKVYYYTHDCLGSVIICSPISYEPSERTPEARMCFRVEPELCSLP